MPLLAYCIVKEAAEIVMPKSGLQQEKVQAITGSGLIALVSEYHQDDRLDDAKVSALAFNQVLQDQLRQTTIIPFRFPTIVDSANEIVDFLREHADEYHKTLNRLQGLVQMEINVSLEGALPKPSGEESGTEYLVKRQKQGHRLAEAASLFRGRSAAHTQEWRQREGSNSVRCFALLRSSEIEAFLREMKSIQLPSDVYARITGPWPATEFLKEK